MKDRAIKFKAITIDGDKWVYGGATSEDHSPNNKREIVSCEFMEGQEEDEHYFIAEVKEGTICQFTGLFDKNGKEIYEGDILLYHEASGKSSFKVQVAYRAASCSFIMRWNTLEDSRTIQRFKSFDANMGGEDGVYQSSVEVIGNIHSTPELIQSLTA